MQVILDSSFARPGSAPIWAGRKESSGTGLANTGIGWRFMDQLADLDFADDIALVSTPGLHHPTSDAKDLKDERQARRIFPVNRFKHQ